MITDDEIIGLCDCCRDVSHCNWSGLIYDIECCAVVRRILFDIGGIDIDIAALRDRMAEIVLRQLSDEPLA